MLNVHFVVNIRRFFLFISRSAAETAAGGAMVSCAAGNILVPWCTHHYNGKKIIFFEQVDSFFLDHSSSGYIIVYYIYIVYGIYECIVKQNKKDTFSCCVAHCVYMRVAGWYLYIGYRYIKKRISLKRK